MELTSYYQRIRQIEAGLQEAFVVLVSLETPDGGKAGVRTEAPRTVAAKFIAEGWARPATEEETQEFQAQKQAAKKEAERRETASRIHFAILPESELGNLKPQRGSKQ